MSKDSLDSPALMPPPKRQSSAPSSPRRASDSIIYTGYAPKLSRNTPQSNLFSAPWPNSIRKWIVEIDRHQFEELTEKLADETKHARLVMDLLQELTGRKVTFADLRWLPEDQKLARIRARHSKSVATLLHGNGTIKAKEIRRQDEELERAAITLTEGGGGALYEVCSRLKKPGVEGKIAEVFREILLDEVAHKNVGLRSLATLIVNERTFRRATRILCEVSSQRLRMRNEQFNFPLTEDELMILDQRARVSVTKEASTAKPRPKSKKICRKERKGRKKNFL